MDPTRDYLIVRRDMVCITLFESEYFDLFCESAAEFFKYNLAVFVDDLFTAEIDSELFPIY